CRLETCPFCRPWRARNRPRLEPARQHAGASLPAPRGAFRCRVLGAAADWLRAGGGRAAVRRVRARARRLRGVAVRCRAEAAVVFIPSRAGAGAANGRRAGRRASRPRRCEGAGRSAARPLGRGRAPPLPVPSSPGGPAAMKVKIKCWNGVATWLWVANDENCGICRMAFNGCCPDCKVPGDDCPLVWGQCSHCFHMHCILKWLNAQQVQQHCPMCRQEWKFKE
uniref:Anaphase-promoting complex subunit 11 n=1 Tax=Equus asinus TaxID=9793 RepID=A0A9L0K5J0_EQUAS